LSHIDPRFIVVAVATQTLQIVNIISPAMYQRLDMVKLSSWDYQPFDLAYNAERVIT
jgi:hypothetical protein